MSKVEITLTEEEKLTLEFRTFEYHGLQINIDRFLHSEEEYNQEHYNRLVNTMLEKYACLQKCLLEVLENHGYKKAKVQNYDFYLTEGMLNVSV